MHGIAAGKELMQHPKLSPRGGDWKIRSMVKGSKNSGKSILERSGAAQQLHKDTPYTLFPLTRLRAINLLLQKDSDDPRVHHRVAVIRNSEKQGRPKGAFLWRQKQLACPNVTYSVDGGH